MYREVLNQLSVWQEKHEENPQILLLCGAKGVGKTYTLMDFGAGFFDNMAVFDFAAQDYVRFMFDEKPDRDSIIKRLSVSCGESIVPGRTLLVFENVDIMENACRIIEFLGENLKDYHLAVTFFYNEKDFIKKHGEIGKYLNVVEMFPLSFNEFLIVNKENEFCEKIEKQAEEPISDDDIKKLYDYLKIYIAIGGMPKVVKEYIDSGSVEKAMEVKRQILEEMVLSMDSIEMKPLGDKVKQVFKSIPAQLTKENKKFQYGVVKASARSREYREAVMWLMDRKYITAKYRVTEPEIPVEDHIDEKSFEIFLYDIGLLTGLMDITWDDIRKADDVFSLGNGAVVEQYVFGELAHNPNIKTLFYWTSDATARIPVLFQDDKMVIPVEINLDENQKAQSIRVYKSKYNTKMSIRITRKEMKVEGNTLYVPLFSIWNI